MTRIGGLLVQAVDGGGVVILDESSGEEVFIPPDRLAAVWEAIAYFVPIPAPAPAPGVTP